MNWYLVAIAVWFLIEIGVVLGRSGKKREGSYSFWSTLFCLSVMFILIIEAIKHGGLP